MSDLKLRSFCSSNSSYDNMPFGFQSQVEFRAFNDLLRSRSGCFLDSKRARDQQQVKQELAKRTAWDINPPDLSLQIYQPKPTKRSSREAMIPGYNEEEWRRNVKEKALQRVKFERVPLPKILQLPVQERAPFTTRFRIPDSYVAKLRYVKEGMHQVEPYSAPGPHAFRGDGFRPLESPKKYGLPDFTTSYEHDPGNIKFKSRSLDVLYESYRNTNLMDKDDGYRKQMITYQESEPDWEVSLILPKGSYKKGRSPKTALMNHIARQLPWCADQNKRHLSRPDVFDHKTVDWLAITSYNRI